MAKRHFHFVKVGDTENPDAIVTRIVHISDTHNKHDSYLDSIPDGDILIHSGDFSNYRMMRHLAPERDFNKFMKSLNSFFSKLKHKHKIFVPGNHDLNLDTQPWERVQNKLTNGIYLQDRPVMLEGIKFYGAGWNVLRASSYARGFAVDRDKISEHWEKIPQGIDVLVTHSPPFAILDCTATRRAGGMLRCDPKAKKHCAHGHIGCPSLRDIVLNHVQPKMHLFGHSHGGNLAFTHKNILFSNAAMSARPCPVVIDYYRPPGSPTETDLTVPEWTEHGWSCNIS